MSNPNLSAAASSCACAILKGFNSAISRSPFLGIHNKKRRQISLTPLSSIQLCIDKKLYNIKSFSCQENKIFTYGDGWLSHLVCQENRLGDLAHGLPTVHARFSNPFERLFFIQTMLLHRS